MMRDSMAQAVHIDPDELDRRNAAANPINRSARSHRPIALSGVAAAIARAMSAVSGLGARASSSAGGSGRSGLVWFPKQGPTGALVPLIWIIGDYR